MAFDPTKDYITRREKYLTKMAGNENVQVPDPITREEQYLSAIANNISGGGGGGGGGMLVVNVTETETDNKYLYTCDKTAGEILSALEEKAVIFKYEYGYIESCVGGGQYLGGYQFVRGGTSTGDVQFIASDLTDYPYYYED